MHNNVVMQIQGGKMETQNECTLTRSERKVLEFCRSKNIAVATYSDFAELNLKERQLRYIFKSLKSKGLLKTKILTKKQILKQIDIDSKKEKGVI